MHLSGLIYGNISPAYSILSRNAATHATKNKDL